jgi:hypothetical protein
MHTLNQIRHQVTVKPSVKKAKNNIAKTLPRYSVAALKLPAPEQ